MEPKLSYKEPVQKIRDFGARLNNNAKATDAGHFMDEDIKENTMTPYPGEDLTVEVDCRQIEQLLLNILVNAWQAIPKGGELYLQTENTKSQRNS